MLSCAIARQKLSRYVAELRDAGGREKFTTAVKAGYVGSIVTPLRALAGNASWGGLRHLVLQPTEAAIDYALSVGKSVMTGGRVKPHEFREVANALDADGAKILWEGFKKGGKPANEASVAAANAPIRQRLHVFVRELSTRLDAEHIYRSLEFDRVKYKNPVAQTMVDGAFAVLEGTDRPFWKMAHDGSVYMQAKLMAIREGLKGDALKARSAELFERPTDEMLLRAHDDANYATFKDRGVLHGGAQSVKRFLKSMADKEVPATAKGHARAQAMAKKGTAGVASVVTEVTIPFTGVPSSVTGKMASLSPFGLLNPKILGSQAERARVLAAAGVGSAMMAAAIALYHKGLATGAMPSNPTERAQWAEAGIQPYSVRIGDQWVGLMSLGPVFASQLAMGIALADAAEQGDSPADAAATAVAGGVKFLTQQTYLKTLGDIVEAARGEASPLGVLVSAIPAPAIVGQANRAIDKKQRDLRAPKHRLLAKLPGGTFLAPEKLGPSGPLPEKTVPERLGAIASPLPIKTSHDNSLLREIRRLGVSFGMPARTVRESGKSARLSEADYKELVKRAGPETINELWAVFRDPAYRSLSDEERKAEFDSIVREIRSAARESIKERVLAEK